MFNQWSSFYNWDEDFVTSCTITINFYHNRKTLKNSWRKKKKSTFCKIWESLASTDANWQFACEMKIDNNDNIANQNRLIIVRSHLHSKRTTTSTSRFNKNSQLANFCGCFFFDIVARHMNQHHESLYRELVSEFPSVLLVPQSMYVIEYNVESLRENHWK